MTWLLLDEDIVNIPIQRGTLPRGESGEDVHFRLDPRVLRRIAEIVEQKQHIMFGTKSDVFRYGCDLVLQTIAEQDGDKSLAVYFAEQELNQMMRAKQEVQGFIDKMSQQVKESWNDAGEIEFLRGVAERYCTALGNDGVTDEVMRLFK